MAGRKRDKKLVTAIIIATVFVLAALITHFSSGGNLSPVQQAGLVQTPPEGEMRVNFIDVGQGDCTLITCGKNAILIDSGEAGNSQKVISYIRNQGIRRLDCIIATHPHSDHIGCMDDVLYSFKIGDVIMPEIPDKLVPTTVCYEKFMKAVERRAENAYYSEVGDKYTYGDLSFQILAPCRSYDDLNNMSVVIKLTYKETSVVMTGDACFDSEADMLKNDFDYSAQLLKIGHHGSSSSSSEAWIKAVKPEYGVICCGKNNDYGHPHKETKALLKKHKITYFRTDLSGDIVFGSDGKTIKQITV